MNNQHEVNGLQLPLVLENETLNDELLARCGRALRRIRIAQGISQEDVANGCDYDQSSLSKVERMGLQKASSFSIRLIADYLGVEIVLGDDKTPFENLDVLPSRKSWASIKNLYSAGQNVKIIIRDAS